MSAESPDEAASKFARAFPTWEGDYGDRLQKCVALLYINGYLSDVEKDKVRARIEKAWIKESLK